jgi:hypothetical protein
MLASVEQGAGAHDVLRPAGIARSRAVSSAPASVRDAVSDIAMPGLHRADNACIGKGARAHAAAASLALDDRQASCGAAHSLAEIARSGSLTE